MKKSIVLLLCLSMLFSIAGCGKENTADETTPGVNVAEMKIESAQDACEQLRELGEKCGYENALSVLTEKSTATIDGDSYYRLQQNYQGIPVYGRTVVCATDAEGNVTSITGNVLDVNAQIDLVPTVTDVEVYDSISAYAADILLRSDALVSIPILSEEYLVIYIQSAGKSALAYQLTVYVGEELYRTVVDANTAVIYEMSSLVLTETLTIEYYLDADAKSADINLFLEDGVYSFYDQERNIALYSANGETLVIYYIFYDTNDEICYYYYPEEDLWMSSKKEAILWPASDYAYVHYGFETSERAAGVCEVTASTLDELPADACETMACLATVNNFFSECLGRDGWANDYTQLLPVVYNCANGSYANSDYGITMISLKTGSGLNTVAHEFMHTVEQSESAMVYLGESGAIMEALSDIYGEVSEYYCFQSCDWLYDGGTRNLIRPDLSAEVGLAHPSKYLDEYWIDTNVAWDNGGVHINSTVISHAAYLMSESGNGLLGMDDLAKLWYRAMLMMPSDCDFAMCRKVVEYAALSMGNLTDEQRKCIGEAFDEVGIENLYDADDTMQHIEYTVTEDSTLCVYDRYNELYSEYELSIYGPIAIDESGLGARIMCMQTQSNTVTVGEAAPYKLDLDIGVYKISISDKYSADVYSFIVQISDEAEDDEIVLITSYETPLVVEIPEETKPNEQEPEEIDTAKQLTGINLFVGGEKTSEVTFEYDDQGRLIYYRECSVSQDGIDAGKTYTYDELGRLVRIEKTYKEYGEYIFSDVFQYNELGQIVSGSYQSGGGWSEYVNTYDDDGRLIKTLEEHQVGTTESKYTYNSDGLLIQIVAKTDCGGDIYTETTSYTYDQQGRISVAEWQSGNDYSRTTYNHDYQSFVVREYDTGSVSVSFVYQDIDIWNAFLEEATFTTDEGGCLLSISGHDSWSGDYSWEFVYGTTDDLQQEIIPEETKDKEQPDDGQIEGSVQNYSLIFSSYQSALAGKSYSVDYVSEDLTWLASMDPDLKPYYSLVDLNGDGIQEMIVGAGYSVESVDIFDVFSHDGEKPVRIVDNTSLGHRAHMTIYTDGSFKIYGSSGADDSSTDHYYLPQGSCTAAKQSSSGTLELKLSWTEMELN